MLIIHIGRGKAGSTTIQRLTVQHRAWFAQHGVTCPDVGVTGNHRKLFEELLASDGPQEQAEMLRRLAAEHTAGHVFVSSEFLIGLPPASVQRLRDVLAGTPVQILCYLREYPGWLVSRYGQSVKKGRTTRDFPAFFNLRLATTPVTEQLTPWADMFGWDRLRVRTLDRDVLAGGDLSLDLLDALGIAAPVPPMPSQNIAPGWPMLELMRGYYKGCAAAGHKPSQRALRQLGRLLDESIAATGETPKASYMTASLWETAAAIYESDLRILNEKLGTAFRMQAKPPAAVAAPDLMLLPAAARRRFADRIERAARAGRLAPEEAAIVRTMPAFTGEGISPKARIL